jgi:glucose-6-phosphate isomerase
MLKIDLQNMFVDKLGVGPDKQELDAIRDKLLEVRKKFINEDIGFKQLPYNYENLLKDLEFSLELTKGLNTIVVVGIGGSDLGAKAIHQAINHKFYNYRNPARKIFFMGDTTDPDSITETLDMIDLEKSLFIIVSKSGNTIEQSSLFVYLRDEYLKLNKEEPIKHFLFLTDPIIGTLRRLSVDLKYNAIEIPGNVGGRFSVLSAVGMVPGYLTGVNIEALLNGAKELDQNFQKETLYDDILNYVGLIYLYYKADKKISILMPYQKKLFEFSRWYRQLIAESLGKKFNNDKEVVHEGIIPIAAIGPADQHSQLQLYNEGPNEEILTFIKVTNSQNNIKLPDDVGDMKEFDFLEGKLFNEILNLEQETTAFSLTKNGRPNCTIEIPKLDEYHLGQLFYFFELVTVLVGFLLEIDPFDQPGVELSKNAMYGVLGRPGFEKFKEDFENFKQGN